MTATAPTFGTAPRDLDAGVDPDLSALTTGDVDTDLEDIRAELNADVAATTVLKVEGRPGWAVQCRIDFTGKDVDGIRKQAKDKKFVDGIDGVKFAALLLAITCVGITRNGTPLEDLLGESQPVTFTSRALQELLGTHDANSTVRKLYGLEGHVDAAARRLMAEAGWGDEADLADPTV